MADLGFHKDEVLRYLKDWNVTETEPSDLPERT